MKLYEITNKTLDLIHDSEITEEELQQAGEELALALQQKSKDIVGVYKNIESDIDSLDAEITRLTQIKKAKENSLSRFKDYIKTNMEQLNLAKIETDIGSISIAKNPISVEIIDEDKIPAEYKTIVQTTKIDKKAIADNFKQTGELIEGVKIHSDNTSLRIK